MSGCRAPASPLQKKVRQTARRHDSRAGCVLGASPTRRKSGLAAAPLFRCCSLLSPTFAPPARVFFAHAPPFPRSLRGFHAVRVTPGAPACRGRAIKRAARAKLLSARRTRTKRDSSQTCLPPRRCVWVSVPLFLGHATGAASATARGMFLRRRRAPTAGRRGAPKSFRQTLSLPRSVYFWVAAARPPAQPPRFPRPAPLIRCRGPAQLGG